MAAGPGRGDVSASATLLAAWRDELNARFAREGDGLAPAAMLGYLRRTVTPILDGWDGDPPAAVLLALFELGLAGLRAGLVGERDAPSRFEEVLRARMPALAPQVASAPSLVLRALGNGYLNVTRARGAAVAAAWLEALAAGAARCADRTALLDLGVVLGWRAGLAEAREVALERVARLEPALITALFGGAIDPEPARRFCRPGATAPLGGLGLVAIAGGFVGFGGPFRRPPRPRVIAGRLVCTDGDATLELCADGFGARLVDATWAHAEAQTSTEVGDATVDARGAVHALGVSATVPEARGASAVAACTAVVAVTLDDSHQVLVLGRREAA